MEQELTSLLHNTSELLRLVPAENIEWGRSSQGIKTTRVVLSRISVVRDYHLKGASGYKVSRVQIEIYGTRYLVVTSVGDAIIKLLSGYRGGCILGSFIDSQRDFSGIEPDDPNLSFRLSIDVIVHHV